MILLISFSILFITLFFLVIAAWRFLTRKPDFEQLEVNGSIKDLIKTLVSEINAALSLNQLELIHKFNPNERPIDGEVAANVTLKLAQTSPYMIIFSYEPNGDVKIVLRKLFNDGK